MGELKIPGFSTYMHPLDETHLLALGYEADDQGDFAYFNGIQRVQIQCGRYAALIRAV